MVAKTWTDPCSRPTTLEKAFKLAVDLVDRIQKTEPFKRNTAPWNPADLNEISAHDAEVNEISHGRWNNQHSSGGSGGYKGHYQRKDPKTWHNQDK